MSQQQKQLEQLDLHTNVEQRIKDGSNSELIKRKKIENTPFWIVGNDEQGYFLALGINRISEIMQTPELVELYLRTNMWDVITKVMIVMIKELPDYIKTIDNLNTTQQ